MNTTFYIAKRYAFSRSKVKAINIITLISSLGIIVGAMALFVVLSVFSGLEKHTLSFINDIDADLTVSPVNGKKMTVQADKYEEVRAIEGVEVVSRVVEEKVVFVYDDKQLVGNIKAVDENYADIVQIKKYLIAANWLMPGTNEVVLGNLFAQQLSLSMYSSSAKGVLQAMAMKPGKGAITMPHQAYNRMTLVPADLYLFDNAELDSKYVYAHLSLGLQLLSMLPDEVTKLELKIDKNANENQIIAQINELFDKEVNIKNKIQNNESLYKMLQTEKLAVYLIFSLVIAVTLFCLAGALIMIVLEKKDNFRTLSALGLNFYQLRRIILYQGLILSIGGAIFGLLLGYLVVLSQKQWEWLMVNEYFPYPVEIDFNNFLIVLLTLLVLGFLASLFASTRVNKS